MSINLDAIQARRKEHGPCTAEVCGSRICQTARDRDALLAYARDLEARLEAGRARVGELMSEQMYGELHYEDLEELRAALTATEGPA